MRVGGLVYPRAVPATRHLLGLALALAAVGCVVAGTLLGLHFASGATATTDVDHHVEFMDPAWHALSWLAVPLVVAAAWHSPWCAAVAGVAGAAVGLGGAAETVRRFDASGFSSGLEIFAFLSPLGFLAVAMIGLVIGGTLGHQQRRRRAAIEAARRQRQTPPVRPHPYANGPASGPTGG